MLAAIKRGPSARPHEVHVGVAEAVPKFIAFRLIEPALSLSEPIRLVCHEGSPVDRLARLAPGAARSLDTHDSRLESDPANPPIWSPSTEWATG